MESETDTRNPKRHPNMTSENILPTTVTEIVAVAETVFADEAAVSCVIITTWGKARVTRGSSQTPHLVEFVSY